MLAVVVALALAGCDSDAEQGDGIDPTPEDQSGRPSTEFEPEDIEQAEGADRLVQLYCGDVPSEAQRVGCLSHVTESDVCEQDTAAKSDAVAAYVEETGTDPC